MTIKNLYPAVRPSLSLDFAKLKRLDPRVTFTRATSAQYYDGVTTVKGDENLIPHSESSTEKASIDQTITSSTEIAPNGTATAFLHTENASGTGGPRSYITSAIFGQTGEFYTLSVYLKADTSTFGYLALRTAAGNTASAIFNLTNGTVANTYQFGGFAQVPATASVRSIGDGWYRCTLTAKAGQNSYLAAFVGVSDGTAIYQNGYPTQVMTGKTIYSWGWQLEERDFATDYLKTTNLPVTRFGYALQSATDNVPRFDHDPVTGESFGLFLEDTRTNIVTYSQDFTNGVWGIGSGAYTIPNTVVAPDGTLTGTKLAEGKAGTGKTLRRTGQITNNIQTVSLYLKAGERTSCTLLILNGANLASFHINLLTGETLTGNGNFGLTYTATDVGNGWYRVTATFTPSVAPVANDYWDIRVSNVWPPMSATGSSYLGDGISGLYVWGAQHETNSAFATSYIPTTASQVTRSLDLATMTGSNFSSWYRQDEGTLYVDYRLGRKFASMRAVAVFDSAVPSANYIEVIAGAGIPPTVGTGGYMFIVNSTVATAFTTGAGLITNTANARRVFAGAYKYNNIAHSNNGGVVGVASNSTNMPIPRVDTLNFNNHASTSTTTLCGHVRRFVYYPQRLTNPQLQALTSNQ